MGALIIRIGFGLGVPYTIIVIIVIRNPKNNIGNYWAPEVGCYFRSYSNTLHDYWHSDF